MWGIIHQIFSSLRCYRQLLGGHWYHVEIVVFDMIVSGWVQKPEPHEEITQEENWTMLTAMFGESEFDSSNSEIKPPAIEPVIIKIFHTVGENALSSEDGQHLYAMAKIVLEIDGQVILDFEDVLFLTTVFLNCSVGHLIKDYDREQIKLTGLSKIQQDLVEEIIQNAEICYKKHQQ